MMSMYSRGETLIFWCKTCKAINNKKVFIYPCVYIPYMHFNISMQNLVILNTHSQTLNCTSIHRLHAI